MLLLKIEIIKESGAIQPCHTPVKKPAGLVMYYTLTGIHAVKTTNNKTNNNIFLSVILIVCLLT